MRTVITPLGLLSFFIGGVPPASRLSLRHVWLLVRSTAPPQSLGALSSSILYPKRVTFETRPGFGSFSAMRAETNAATRDTSNAKRRLE